MYLARLKESEVLSHGKLVSAEFINTETLKFCIREKLKWRLTAMIKEEWWHTKEVTNEVFQGAVSEFLFAFCANHITEHKLTAANNGEAPWTQHN